MKKVIEVKEQVDIDSLDENKIYMIRWQSGNIMKASVLKMYGKTNMWFWSAFSGESGTGEHFTYSSLKKLISSYIDEGDIYEFNTLEDFIKNYQKVKNPNFSWVEYLRDLSYSEKPLSVCGEDMYIESHCVSPGVCGDGWDGFSFSNGSQIILRMSNMNEINILG